MSYEGHVQHLCEKGHRFDRDAYASERPVKCPCCGGASVWENGVDDTNCDSWGVIPDEVWEREFRKTEAVVETCNLGHEHVVAPAEYRVPTAEERRGSRSYWVPSVDGRGAFLRCEAREE